MFLKYDCPKMLFLSKPQKQVHLEVCCPYSGKQTFIYSFVYNE